MALLAQIPGVVVVEVRTAEELASVAGLIIPGRGVGAGGGAPAPLTHQHYTAVGDTGSGSSGALFGAAAAAAAQAPFQQQQQHDAEVLFVPTGGAFGDAAASPTTAALLGLSPPSGLNISTLGPFASGGAAQGGTAQGGAAQGGAAHAPGAAAAAAAGAPQEYGGLLAELQASAGLSPEQVWAVCVACVRARCAWLCATGAAVCVRPCHAQHAANNPAITSSCPRTAPHTTRHAHPSLCLLNRLSRLPL
jgi:hypothetical protein